MSRVMIVEDEWILAETLARVLRNSGHDVVGPFMHLEEAQDAAQNRAIDAALLDIRIAGGYVFPVADILHARGIPYAFVTATDPANAPGAHRNAPVARKPADMRTVEILLARLLTPCHPA